MIYDLFVPQAIKMLKNLSVCLDKGVRYADNKKFDPEVLLTSRLAPDQFHFTRQVQIACDVAKFGAARLTGKEAPSHPDSERTIGEVRARLQSVISYLQGFKAQDFSGAQDRKITQARWEGKTMYGQDYVLQYVLPNLYFHVTTAYAILRHNGVDIGKNDYLGELPFKN